MVKTKRTIITEEDRYGGYNMRPNPSQDYGAVSQYSETKTYDYSDLVGQTFSLSAPQQATRQSTQYIAPRQMRRETQFMPTIQHEQISDGAIAITQDVEIERAKRQAEFMPMVRVRQRQAQKRGVVRNKSAEKGLPLSLILYITAVVLLATAVIATGLIMAGVSSNASALEQRRDYLAEQVADAQAELTLTQDQDAIRDAATDLGMVPVPNTYSVTLLTMSTPQEHTAITNWFDRLVRVFTGQL